MLNPAKTDLTGPAKTILTNPTFLPETVDGAAALGGTAEASGAVGLFEASTLLPALGAFGIGVAAGSEICHVVGIEGCWFFGHEAADPAPGVAGFEWEFREKAGSYTFIWVWSRGASGYEGVNAYPPKCGGALAPAGYNVLISPLPITACSISTTTESLGRYSMTNRKLEYHSSDSGTIGNYEPGGKPYEANSKWSEKAASALKEQSDSTEVGRVGKHIASQIEGSKVADPYPHKVTVPSCSGESWIECKADLEELDLKPERKELDWSDAHLDLAPDEVVELEPAPGTKVSVPTETKTIVTTNPDEAGMPIVVPQPESGETYDHYAARLNPALTPERHDLEASFVDPSVGPNGVVEVQPEPDTRLDPSKSHDVKVTTNPADAPAAVPAWSPPAIPSIDMSPLTGVGSPCSVFPFGLLCWLGEGLAQFNTAGECPSSAVPVNDDVDFDLTLCGDVSDQVMNYVRPAILLVFIVGCGFLFARATKAVGGD